MISVIVCTRNRAPGLERCLMHMCEIRPAPDFAWQLVVVDNGSEDATRAVVQRFARSLPLTYVFEERAGLSLARNRGIAASQHPIVAFTDDDCLVRPDWLANIANAFAGDAELSILGGPVEQADAADYPVATRAHQAEQGITAVEEIVSLMIGCNMALRREVFNAAGLFDPAFGKGTSIGSAEDIDLLYRALKQGRKIVYSPEVVVYHAHGRNAPASIETLTRDYVRGRGAFYWKFISDPRILKMAYWEIRALVKDCLQVQGRPGSLSILRHLVAGALRKCMGDLTASPARTRYRSTS